MNEEYNMPPLGLFGKRCRIKNVHNMDDGFVYRIVDSGIRSNCWKEPPLGRWGNEPIQHDKMEEIVIVICDTLIDDTSKLERVALKDVAIMDEQEDVLDKIETAIRGKYRVILKDTPKDDWAVRWNECIDEVIEIIGKYREGSKK